MAKIIIEDIKTNKKRNLSSNGKVVLSSHEAVANKNIKQKITKEPATSQEFFIKKEETQKEKEEIISNDSKIEEYFKNKREEKRISRTPQLRNKPRLIKKTILAVFLLCVIAGVVYWGGNIFYKANINITSKHELIDYKDKQFIASKDQNNDSVNFEIMITTDKRTKKITLTEAKEVSTKAEGVAILYNEFGATPVKLSVGTFLSDEEGKAYKTNSTITIPGSKTVNGEIIPGQIEVGITSFLPGEAYNGSPSNFYINSLKGTTRYNKIYGKLKDPLVGGAQGLVYEIDSANDTGIDKIAQSSLKDDLVEKVKALVPPGYILYPGASTFSYKTGDNGIFSKTPEAEVEIEGTLAVVLIKEKSLMDNIIKISLKDITKEELKEINIHNLDKLSFSFADNNQTITKDIDTVSFNMTGQIEAIWEPDIEILKSQLLGVHKDQVLPIFRQDKGISSAIIKIFPPWKKYIPNNITKININVD